MLLFDKHIYNAIRKASNICNMIISNIKNVNIDTYITLFKCYVRPVLDYSSVVYSPHHLYLINAIERVQRYFTKRLPGLFNIPYLQCLNICNIDLLETRRIKTDLIMLYKVLHGVVCCNNIRDNIMLSTVTNTRGNKYKLMKNCVKRDVKKYFFCNRVINMWNLLPNNIVCSNNVSTFVHRLNLFDFTPFLKGRVLK
jgi:hypothetical protein